VRRLLAGLVLSLFLFPLSAFGFSIRPSGAVKSGGGTAHLVINEAALNTTDPAARWFELYNPTESSVSLDKFVLSIRGIYGLFPLPRHVTIPPDGYVVIAAKEENFASYWGVSPGSINVYEGLVPYVPWDFVVRPDGVIEGAFWINSVWDGENVCDGIGESPELYILPPGSPVNLIFPPGYPLNHSWARYAGGYDTDNFANDFYDEPNPTPGRPNSRVKGVTPPLPVPGELVVLCVGTVIIAIIVALGLLGLPPFRKSNEGRIVVRGKVPLLLSSTAYYRYFG